MPLPARILLFFGMLLPELAVAQASYRIDPIHSRVVFRVMHAGLSPSLGTVSTPSGRIEWDETTCRYRSPASTWAIRNGTGKR
jgi:polyisoprenoid-binding protein YceI